MELQIARLPKKMFFKHTLDKMLFLIDSKNKIMFGWSAKCGCSHIKKIFYFLINNKTDNPIHTGKDYNSNFPKDIENYTTIMIIRNPYKRLISGFKHKYKTGGQLRNLWKDKLITFSEFVDKLITNFTNDPSHIHHFTPQTSEVFRQDVFKSKQCIFYDIENIDYAFIENLYKKKIPEVLINFKNESSNADTDLEEYVYNLDVESYSNHRVKCQFFYNDEIKEKVYNYYKNDFVTFKEHGFDYEKSMI